ncbi:spore coat U domain-containing protein [Novosphingobium sp. 9]|uniref:Csu type fimbrial protein n=1 Tax=Novosphingobium sp. 9 TaxID=2025349 RepID=UPI0021B5CCE7|nr:spore coat U domain-containing protein [Novosphingobium sp. 9]
MKNVAPRISLALRAAAGLPASPRFRNLAAVLALGAAATIPLSAQAATATDPMAVTATVISACIIDAADLPFGNYDPTSSTPKDMNTTITVTCTVGTPFTVGLNAGSTSGATVTTRQMANGANRLGYALYSDTGHATNWGNTSGTDTPAQATATATSTVMTVYGRIAARQNVPAGSYTDSVTATVYY